MKGHLYAVRKHKASGDYVVWNRTLNRPVSKSRMRLEQAQDLCQRMNIDARRRGSPERSGTASRVVALRALLRAHGFHPKEAHRLLMGQPEGKIVSDLGKQGKVRDVAPTVKLDAVQREIARRVAGDSASSVRDSGNGQVNRFIEKRMRAFAHGHLRDSAGAVVTDAARAREIVLAEARAKGYAVGDADHVRDSSRGLTAEERAEILRDAKAVT